MTGDFEREIAKVRPRMLALAIRMTRNHCEAEDVVQDAVLAVWPQFANIDRLRIKSYCLKAVQNKAYDLARERRKQAVVDTLTSDMETLPCMGRTDPDPFADEISHRLNKALQSVPSGYQRVIQMVAEDATIRDVAAEFGLLEATAKTRMYRAREYMKAALA